MMTVIGRGNTRLRARVGFALVTAVCIAGCTQDELIQPTGFPPAFLANISNPVNAAAGAGQLLGASTSVYVSLPPGTVPGGESATVENRRTGAAVTTAFVEGGFDPVAIPAEVGDTIRIVARKLGGEVVAEFKVQPRRRPVVVRTDPPPGKKDVPLNATLVIVLSEPIDAASLTAVSVHLQANSDPVAGSVQLVPGAPWSVRFIPADSLAPWTMYELVVSPELRDQDGDALESQAVVPFTTAALPPLPPPGPAPAAGRLAFVSTRDGGPAVGYLSRPFIYLANADGSGVTRFRMGESPAWSWDGRRLAFHRYSDGLAGSGTVQLVVVNADGSGERVLVNGGFRPSWSPDGRFIVYNTGVGVPNAGVYIVNVEGVPTPRLLIDYGFALPDDGYGPGWVGNASWSPDGRSITFVRANYGIPWSLYVMAADGSSGPRLFSPAVGGLGDARPIWSPDGTRILLQMPQWMIGSVNLDGADLRSYANGLYVGDPDWAPDGNRVVFTRFSGPPTPEHFLGTRMRIHVVDVAGGNPRQLIPDAVNPTQPEYWDTQPAWSRVRD